MLVIKSYNENYRNEWDSFVMNSDDASLFHLTGWKDAVEKTFGHKPHYSFAMQDDKITGILPLFDIKSRFFGHALVSVPFGVYGGISAIDQASHESLKMSAETLASAMRVDYLELRSDCSQGFESHSNISNNSNDSSVSNISNGWFLKDLYVTFKRPLCSTVDESFEEIPDVTCGVYPAPVSMRVAVLPKKLQISEVLHSPLISCILIAAERLLHERQGQDGKGNGTAGDFGFLLPQHAQGDRADGRAVSLCIEPGRMVPLRCGNPGLDQLLLLHRYARGL